MVEPRRRRAALAAGTEDVVAAFARQRRRVAREGAVTLAALAFGAGAPNTGWARGTPCCASGGSRRCARPVLDLAQMLDAVIQKKTVGQLASDIEQMLSAAQRVLEEDPAPTPSEGAPSDEAVTPSAPAIVAGPAPGRWLAPAAASDASASTASAPPFALTPPAGLGRSSDEELAPCPPGPAGTRLSWARRASGAAA
jgi:hypothetical protein